MTTLIEKRQRLYPSNKDSSKMGDATLSVLLNKDLNSTKHNEHFFNKDVSEHILKFRKLLRNQPELLEKYDEIFGRNWEKPIEKITPTWQQYTNDKN